MNSKTRRKWKKVNILSAQLCLIEKLCQSKNCDFANPSQFVNFAIRKELDVRQQK